MTTPQIPEQAPPVAAASTTAVKVIIVGNSGVGKSFLANVLLREHTFEHKWQEGSVTAKVETDTTIDDNTITELIVYNIPGLVEVNAANIERNRKAIKEAFAERPELRTVVLFVFDTSRGGRIEPQDCSAFRAIDEFIQPVVKKYGAAISFVVNKVPRREFFDVNNELDVAAYSNYCAMVSRTLKDACGEGNFSGVIKFIDDVEPAHRRDMNSSSVERAHRELMSAIRSLIQFATPIVPDAKAEIRLDRNEEVKMLEVTLKDLREKHEKEMREVSAKHLEALELIREGQQGIAIEHARELAAIKSELEKTDKNNKELHDALILRQQQLEAVMRFVIYRLPDTPEVVPHRGGALSWHAFRTVAAQSLGRMSRSGQSQSYRHYKRTGEMMRFE